MREEEEEKEKNNKNKTESKTDDGMSRLVFCFVHDLKMISLLYT